MRYFEMKDDVYVPGRWYLSDPTDRHGKNLGPWLMEGRPLRVEGPVTVHFNEFTARGDPIDYCELDGVGAAVPVVSVRIASVLREVAPEDVQTIPVLIEGQAGPFCIVNVLQVVRCIDEAKSRHVERFGVEDGDLYGDRVGEYRDVRGMKIDPSRISGDLKVFRTWGWRAIIVSEQIKQAIEHLDATGVRFIEV